MIDYLEYASKKLQEDFNNDKITMEMLIYERSKINNLIRVVNGKGYDGYLLKPKSYRRKFYIDDDLTEAEQEIRKLPEVR